MQDEMYDQIVVKLKYKNYQYGSGALLWSADRKHKYLCTAWHCLNREENVESRSLIVSRQINGKLESVPITIYHHIHNEDLDISILDIEGPSDFPLLQVMDLCRGDKTNIVGFPNALKDASIPRYPLESKIVGTLENNFLQINSERTLSTFENPVKSVVAGYSGSGIYFEYLEELYFGGVVIMLSSSEGAFDSFNGINVKGIQKILLEHGWQPLQDINYCSFGRYKENVIELFEEPLDRICSYQISNIKENVSPKDILEHCGKKLVWPYSEKNIQIKEVWEGWLLYLIIRSIENSDNLKNNNFYIVQENAYVRQVKLIYSTNSKKLSTFLKDYLQHAFMDINQNEILVVKTKQAPVTKVLPFKTIDSIVSDISNVISVEQELRIDDVKSGIRGISLIHIEKFTEELSKIETEGLNEIELEQKLSQRIGEMLHEI